MGVLLFLGIYRGVAFRVDGCGLLESWGVAVNCKSLICEVNIETDLSDHAKVMSSEWLIFFFFFFFLSNLLPHKGLAILTL